MLKRLLPALMVASLAAVTAADARQSPQLRLVVSKFEGQSDLGQNVSTVVALSLWRTLRRPPENDPNAVYSAVVVWPAASDQPVRTPQQAARLRAGFVVWGAASYYGDGVVVDSYLSTPESRDVYNSRWTVRSGEAAVSLDLPREVFHLGSDVMPARLVDHYSSPGVIAVCSTQRPGCTGPAVGDGMTGLQHDVEWSQVRLDSGPTGWIHQPGLARVSGATAPFAGGLIAYYRGQFAYAAQQWAQIASISTAPAALKEDASSLALAARLRAGTSNPTRCDATWDPQSVFLGQVAVMGWLDRAVMASDARRASAFANAATCLGLARALLEPDDPWLLQAENLIQTESSH